MLFFNRTKKEQKEIDLIAMAAHQLRRPLSSMKLSLQMLAKGDFGPLQTEQKDIIEKIISQNTALICLVGDLLDMAQTHDGAHHASSPVDIVSLIDSSLAIHYEELTRKKITIQYDRSSAMPQVKVRKEALEIAISNIIDNAVKYTKEGGWIKIVLAHNQKQVTMSIQDSGIGIPTGEHGRIFGKFFRASNARAAAPGTGLGLFIAKKILQASGGTITFESEEGAGSTFCITLPLP